MSCVRDIIHKPYFFQTKTSYFPPVLSFSSVSLFIISSSHLICFLSHESLKTSHKKFTHLKGKRMPPLSHRLFSHNVLMSSKHLLKCAPGTVHLSSPHSRHFHTRPHLLSTNPEKPTSKIHHLSVKKSGLCSFAPVMLSRTGIC